jgi:hypothetical protein
MGRLATLERIPQISPWATSSKLRDESEFPFFNRMVGVDDGTGQIAGLVSMLRLFGWQRVSIIATDTQYAKDVLVEFQRLWVGVHNDETGTWKGEIAYSASVAVDYNGDLDGRSVTNVLENVPTDDPTINSRVILLIAYVEHAAEILSQMDKFVHPDTIWIDVASWSRKVPKVSTQLPLYPGYLALQFYNDLDGLVYNDFLSG